MTKQRLISIYQKKKKKKKKEERSEEGSIIEKFKSSGNIDAIR